MFGGPLFSPDVQPAGTPQPQMSPQGPAMGELSGPEGRGQQPYGFEQALNDVIDFLGMGGTAQAEGNQLGNEQEAESQGRSPYIPTESSNLLDRRNESPDPLEESYKRYGDDPKQAAARISLMPRGVAPFLSSAYDVATNQNNPRELSLGELYRKRQLEADLLEKDQAPAVSAVRQYAPYIAGGIAGALPSRATGVVGLAGGAIRGGIAGGATGAVEGYFDPSNAGRELSDPARLGSAAKMAGLNTFLGGSAGMAGHLATSSARAGMDKLLPSGTQANKSSVLDKVPLDSKPMLRNRAETEWEQRAFEESLAYRFGMRPEELRPKPKAKVEPAQPVKPTPESDISTPESEPKPAQVKTSPVEPKEAPQGLNKAVEAKPVATEIKPAPKSSKPATEVKPKSVEKGSANESQVRAKGPISQVEFRRFNNTGKGKESWRDIQAESRLKRLRSDTDIVKGDASPPSAREMLAKTGKVPARITPDTGPNEARFAISGTKASYTPKEKRGVMQLSEEISSTSGRQPSKWTPEDKAEFISKAARHTDMSPAKIKSLLKSYGDSPRAQRGMSAQRIKDLVQAERIKTKTEK